MCDARLLTRLSVGRDACALSCAADIPLPRTQNRVIRCEHVATPRPGRFTSMSHLPPFLPTEAHRVTSPSALRLARRYRRTEIYIPSLNRTVDTAHIPAEQRSRKQPPLCFLHGFDSSSFDFRKLLPYVEENCEAWAVDLVGWGFSDHSLYLHEPQLPLGPGVKCEHLYQFWKEQIGRPMCLVGVSLGGAAAMDFALRHPEAVDRLVLSSAQGYIDGLGALSRLPSVMAKLGVQILRTEVLRRYANGLAYHNKSADVEQAMIVGRLHTFLPGDVIIHGVKIRCGGN